MATLGSLPIGAKIKVPHSVMGDIVFLKCDQNHDGYPANSTTLITDKVILLRAFDAKESQNTDSNRRQYGNNRYSVSNIDQWLNSTASAGQWYSPQHDTDQSPNSTKVVVRNPYNSDMGFLTGFDARFIAAMQDTTIKVARNTVTDGGGYDTLTRKVFLPSLAELFNQAENSIMEGSLLQYFQANTDAVRRAYISDYCAQDNNNQGSPNITADSESQYWTRTPKSSNSATVYIVDDGGSRTTTDAYGGWGGVRPLCNLSSDTLVSDQPDGDGVYQIPSFAISGNNEPLGTFVAPFSYKYKILVETNVAVVETLNQTQVRSYTTTGDEEQTFTVTNELWTTIPDGDNFIQITATKDDKTVTQIKHFVKKSALQLKYTACPSTTVQPTAINAELDYTKPFGADLEVLVCNNGNDEQPTWEDMTTAVKMGANHIFKNTTKTAKSWKVVLQVSIIRNSSTGDIKLRGIKTTFDKDLNKGRLDRIYGVDLVGSEDPNALVRTDDAIGLNVTVGTSEITSDFDSYYPWNSIEEVTDDAGNVFIKIPKFYSKITKNADGTYKHQLSGTKHEGFDTLFKVGTKEIDYVMVGKYEGSGSSERVYSKSGRKLLVEITMDDFRNGCKANGIGYQQYDFLIDLIIKELWLIEMKTTDCQSIMCGYTNGHHSSAFSGDTDDISTPSGSPVSNTDGNHACKYRGIENPWGNIYKRCDGISFSGSSVYICTEPSAYQSGNITEPYVLYGTRASSDGYAKTVEPLKEGSLIQYVTTVNTAQGAYYCDFAEIDGSILLSGGSFSSRTSAGLWCWNSGNPASHSSISTGGRLCYKPSQPT
jgi:hypothetical protein